MSEDLVKKLHGKLALKFTQNPGTVLNPVVH